MQNYIFGLLLTAFVIDIIRLKSESSKSKQPTSESYYDKNPSSSDFASDENIESMRISVDGEEADVKIKDKKKKNKNTYITVQFCMS